MESLSPRPEQQHGYSNTQLANAIRGLIPYSDTEPFNEWRGDGMLYDASYQLDDGTRVDIGVNLFGNVPDNEQPFFLTVHGPIVDGVREVEDYLFGVTAGRRRGISFSLTSDLFVDTVNEEGRTISRVYALGFTALHRQNIINVFGSKEKRLKHKERKAVREALSLQMDDDRATRLLGLLAQCNEDTLIEEDQEG